ncbi:MAG: patatin-like phospholipase family protein [Actinomycetales bacterium]
MRRGLVLGGGGVLGAAWMVGALTALEQELGLDLREFDEIVGTSAGSVVSALLGAGVSVDELRHHQMGEPVGDRSRLAGFSWDYENATGGDLPQRPRARMGSRAMLLHNARHLRRLPPTAVLSALLPEGRGRLGSVGALVRHVVPQGWVPRGGVRIVAMDYDTGQRVPFGASGMPGSDIADAVMASCAIPGWYQPVRIGGRRYIDGGAWSTTSVDLMVGLELDEVYVVAPMVSFAMDEPTQLTTKLERRWRSRVTRRCLHEVALLHRGGTDVTVIGPGPRDLEAFGANLMDVGRREIVLRTALETTPAALQDAAVLGEGLGRLQGSLADLDAQDGEADEPLDRGEAG